MTWIFEDQELSPEDALELADRVRGLVNDRTFLLLIQGAEGECHREWETGKTAEAREAAWQRLQGIRALEKQIQVTVDRGARAAGVLRGQKPA
jgi:hypothetical protein